MKIFVICLVFMSLASCSNRGIYEGVQAGNRFECSKLPPTQYDECMSRANTPYAEYERERKEALEKE
jgi:hypothetical protein